MLSGIEIWQVPLRMERPVVTSAGAHRERPVIYVHAVGTEAEGWGESAAPGGGTAVDPSHGEVWRALVHDVVPEVLGALRAQGGGLTGPTARPAAGTGPTARPAAGTGPTASAQRRAAAAALDMALLDLELRRDGLSLARHWGLPPGAATEVGAVVGIPEAGRIGPRGARASSEGGRIDRLLEEIGVAAAAGYCRVRIKIAPGWDLAPLRAARGAFPALSLQADANGAYRWGSGGPDDAGGLVALDELSLRCVEQPMAPEDLEGHACLAGVLRTPVCLDESVSSPAALDAVIASRAGSVVCIKPARFGSLERAKEAIARCRSCGVDAFVGGFFETGLARSANVALSCLPGCSLPGDLSDPRTYLHDPCGYPEVVGGVVHALSDAGVGRSPAISRLRALGGRSEWVPVRES